MRLDKIRGWVPRMPNMLGSSAADGSKVVFSEGAWVRSFGHKSWVILGAWVIDLSGPKPSLVQVSPRADAVPPLMSDDGKKVVYFSWTGGTFIVNADASGRSWITGLMSPLGIDAKGARIVGVVSRKDLDTAVINTDGTGLRNLTNTPGFVENAPSITPDGTKVAFGRTHGTLWGKQTTDVMLVNADGTGLRSLAKVPGAAAQSAISADGSRIVMRTAGPTAETRGVLLIRGDTGAVLADFDFGHARISGNGKRLLSQESFLRVVWDYARPDLKALGPEQLGATETLQVAADPGSLWLLGLSDTKASIPLPPFGTLGLDPRRLLILGQGIMGLSRTSRLALPLPSDPHLVGSSIFTQALAFSPSLASGAFSNLVEIRIQNRIEE